MQFYVPSLPLYGTLGQASDARIQFQNVRAVSRIAQRVSVAWIIHEVSSQKRKNALKG